VTGSTAEHWDRRHRSRPPRTTPASFVVEASHWFEPGGRVLDVAGGTGRNAMWLARHGFDLTLVDVSGVAVEMVRQRARESGVSLAALVSDVEDEGLPVGPWDAIVIHHFFHRPLLQATPDLLASGGILAFCQPTVRNLERHDRPGERWLLAEGELAAWAKTERSRFAVVRIEERWFNNGRHEAHLIARLRETRPG
jgi:SAM-dependent methyltransferase